MASGPKSNLASGKANDTRVLALKCKWNGCGTTLALPADGYQAFAEHVLRHLKSYLDEIMPCRNDEETTLALPLKCLWFECQSEIRRSVGEFTRHVMFHAYHSKLKCLGAFIVIAEKLRQCSFDVETQDLLPDLSDPFLCRWESCGLEFYCPDQFYRHVDMHGHEAHREDVLVTTGEKVKAKNDGEFEEELEGLTVQKMMQSVCRWEVNHVKCPHCDMTCPNPSALRSHLKFKHSLDRPFKCSMCDYSCKTKHDLQRHEEIHFEKRFGCEVEGCFYEGKTMSGLRAHVKAVHNRSGVRQFMCHICEKTLSRGFLLTKHLKKAHHFSWPSGHSRFRYKLDEDGYYRLQMVRFESAELTEQLSGGENSRGDNLLNGEEESGSVIIDESSIQNSVIMRDLSAEAAGTDSAVNSVNFSSNDSPDLAQAGLSTPQPNSGVVSLNLNEGYEVLLRYYEMTKENENLNSDFKSSNQNVGIAEDLGKAKEVAESEYYQERIDRNSETKAKRKQLAIDQKHTKRRRKDNR
eukprot:gene15510-6773_t